MDPQGLILKRKAPGKPTHDTDGSKRPKPAEVATKPSARPSPRKNLTLADWLSVFSYVDGHPRIPQQQVVDHFKTLPTGGLIFTQPTLSRKLHERAKLEERVTSYPNALSSKRARSVTRPDVERALVLWMDHAAEKGLPVTGPLLKEKRHRFEEEFDVPDDERLKGGGWVQGFRAAYKGRGVAVDELEKEACLPAPDQLIRVEEEPVECIAELNARGRISGTPPTVNELVDPAEEREAGFDEVSGSDEEAGPRLTRGQVVQLCERLEASCMAYGDPEHSYDLRGKLRSYLAALRREDFG